MAKTDSEIIDPFGTIRQAIWICGGQWAGKSTVARLLAHRHGITVYHYDLHDARAHQDRRIAHRVRNGMPATDPGPDTVWVDPAPEQMAADTIAGFPVRFEWALDDLRALVSGRPILAEGWGLRPELVAPLVDSPPRRCPGSAIPSGRSGTGSHETAWSRKTRFVPRGASVSACWRSTAPATPKRSRTSSPITSVPTWPERDRGRASPPPARENPPGKRCCRGRVRVRG